METLCSGNVKTFHFDIVKHPPSTPQDFLPKQDSGKSTQCHEDLQFRCHSCSENVSDNVFSKQLYSAIWTGDVN